MICSLHDSTSADVSEVKKYINKFRLCFVACALNRSLNDSRSVFEHR